MSVRYEPIPDDEAASLIGEGVHTGLRKGTEAPGSAEAWRVIARPDSGWDDAVKFAIDGLDFMGYAIVKKIEDPVPEPLSPETEAGLERLARSMARTMTGED